MWPFCFIFSFKILNEISFKIISSKNSKYLSEHYYFISLNAKIVTVWFIALLLFTEEPVVSLKLSDQSQSVAHGNTIILQAKIKSYPAPSRIRWTRMMNVNKEEIIEAKGRFSIDVSDLKCPKLTIEDLEFSDNGCYIITVTNDFGIVSAYIDIETDGKYDCVFKL